MKPEEMAKEVVVAFNAGQRITLVRTKSVKMPPKFPKGELLCENYNGSRSYSYDPIQILAWLAANKLINIERNIKE